ncbi:MAG: SAM-dependent chlorinase/fluorinase [Thermodesulfobacteriota bacterium]
MILTLTTDFGTRDGYVAQMKGVALGINPRAVLVDVTHEIEPFGVLEAAFVVRGMAPYYPASTIHVVVVDPGVGSERRGIVVRTPEGLFVGPDNGVFSFVLAGARSPGTGRQKIPTSCNRDGALPTDHSQDACPTRKTASESAQPSTRIWEIRNPRWLREEVHPTFHGREVFAPVAAHLSLGKDPAEAGPEIHDPVTLAIPPVIRTPTGLEGRVIYADRFGNLTTNIEASMLDRTVLTVVAGAVPRVEDHRQCHPPLCPPIKGGETQALSTSSMGGDAQVLSPRGTVKNEGGRARLQYPVDSKEGRRHTVISGISRYFGEVAPGEPLALINSFGFLEIAVNQGNAASTLGLGVDSPVTVTWP